MSRPLPWYFWAAVAACGLLLLLVLVPPLRDFAIEAVTAALAVAVGVRSVQRRGAARDEATEATADHEEAVALEDSQTEQREQRAADLAAEAESEEVRREPPAGPDDKEERRRKVRNPWS